MGRQGSWERKECGEKQKSREKRETECAVAASCQPERSRQAEQGCEGRLCEHHSLAALWGRSGLGGTGIACGKGSLTLGDLGKALLPSAGPKEGAQLVPENSLGN